MNFLIVITLSLIILMILYWNLYIDNELKIKNDFDLKFIKILRGKLKINKDIFEIKVDR